MYTDEVEILNDKLDMVLDHVAAKSVVEAKAMRATESLLRTVLPRLGKANSRYHNIKRELKDMVDGAKHAWRAIHKLEQENSDLKGANSALWEYCDDLDTRLEKLERKLAKRSKKANHRENLLR